MANLQDGSLATFAAQDDASTCQRLDVSAVDATLALAAGLYQVVVDTTVPVIFRLGAEATIPATGSATVSTGWVWGAGVTATLRVPAGGATLHAKTVSASTGTIWPVLVV